MKSWSERDALKEIVEDQLRRHVMEVADLYKLNSQMCFGPRHLLKDKKNARKLLQEEWDALDKVQKGEPLIEMIDPRGEVLRINLRVSRKTGGDPESLFQVMLTSAENVQPDRNRFLLNWEYFMDMARRKTIPFSEEV